MSQPDDRLNDRPPRPLTPVTFHILLSVMQEATYGYRIKRMVEERTNGAVLLGAGTLYAGIQRMTSEGLIEETDPPRDAGEVEPGTRWRFYAVTPRGREVLQREIARLEADLQAARGVVRRPA
jgi:DNA-binding PadR family transcriptional regulator